MPEQPQEARSAAYTLRESKALHELGVTNHGWYMTEAEHRGVLGVLNELETILDDLCDWAQHVSAPEGDAIHFIVERAEEALRDAK
jgi:hypothetical protein